MQEIQGRGVSLKHVPVGTVILLRLREDGLWAGQANLPQGIVRAEGRRLRRVLNQLAARQAALRQPPAVESPRTP